jgi:hypothetical protein
VTRPSSRDRLPDLGLKPVALDLGFFQLRWYSLAYLAGIFIGYWYLLKLLKQPGAPMARRHADDLVFYAALGIILGGRLGYVLFYNLPYYLEHPIDILKLWDGGMSSTAGSSAPRSASSISRARRSCRGCASTIMSPAACRSACSSAASPIS